MDDGMKKLTELTEGLSGQKSELDSMFDSAVNLMCICGADMHFKKLSPSWTKLLGWSEEELTSSPWLFFVHPDDVGLTTIVGNNMVLGNPAKLFVNRYRAKDGSYRTLLWNVPHFGESGLVIGSASDITDIISGAVK
jgi:PAS domain S-box-containing protein